MACGEGTYRIGEVAARTGLTVDTLRFYERVERVAAQLRELVAATLDEVETALNSLQEFRRTLRGYVDAGQEGRRRRDAMRRYSGSGVAVARPTSVKRVDS